MQIDISSHITDLYFYSSVLSLSSKKKKAKLTKLVGRCMFQTTKHLFDNNKTHSMKGLKLSKIWWNIFIYNEPVCKKYSGMNFSTKDYKTKPKKANKIKYINKKNIITSKTFNNLGLKQNLTFWWCRGLSIA